MDDRANRFRAWDPPDGQISRCSCRFSTGRGSSVWCCLPGWSWPAESLPAQGGRLTFQPNEPAGRASVASPLVGAKWLAKVSFARGRSGRQRIKPAPWAVPTGRVPRISKRMALAIRFEGLIRDGHVADQSELAHVSQPSRG